MLHSRERKHQREPELPERGCRIDPEVDRGEHAAEAVDFLDEAKCVGNPGAREPVEAGDGDPADLAVDDASHGSVEAGPAELPAGLVEIGVRLDDLDAAHACPLGDRVGLLGGALEALSGTTRYPRHPQIGVVSGRVRHVGHFTGAVW
jgi:hypothetical protein